MTTIFQALRTGLLDSARFKTQLLLQFFLLTYTANVYGQSGKLSVYVHELMVPEGNLIVELYDSASRAKDVPLMSKTIPATSVRHKVVFEGLTAGRYGLIAQHDQDANGIYEYTKEDYGYSNHAVAHYGPAKFEEIAINYSGQDEEIVITLDNEKASKSTHFVGNTVFSPVIGYTPETSMVLGANMIKFFRFNKADTLSRTSFIDVWGALTLRKQIISDINYTFFTNNEQFMIIGNTGFQRFPQYYFGIGNNLPESNKELIKYDQVRFDNLVLRNIFKKLYAGIGYHYLQVFDLRDGALGLLEDTHVAGFQGARISGLQFCITSDNRNNIYNTSKGHLVRIKYGVNDQLFGSQYNFRSLEGDFRQFIHIKSTRDDVLAFQAYTYLSAGNVPWNEMGALGSEMIMRGYYSGRYRDRNYMAVQAEYRKAFNKMFGMVFFTGLGEVAHNISGFDLSGLKPNGGVGLRMKIDRSERLNLRMDMGFGKHTSNFYFGVAEAF